MDFSSRRFVRPYSVAVILFSLLVLGVMPVLLVYAPNPTVGLVMKGNIEFLASNGGLQFVGQVSFPSGSKFFLRDKSSNVTLGSVLNTSSSLRQYGSSIVVAGVVPVYVLNFPFGYNPVSGNLNITGRSGVAATVTIDTSTVYGTGLKLYNSTSYLTSAPVYDASAFKLSFVLASSGLVKVFSGTEGKPIKVVMDTVEYTENNGWTWDAVNNVVSTYFNGVNFEFIWSGGGGSGSVGSNSGGGPPVAGGPPELIINEGVAEISSAANEVRTVVTPSLDTDRIMLGGVSIIVILVGFAYGSQEYKKRVKPSTLWAEKNAKDAKKKIPWKDKELKY